MYALSFLQLSETPTRFLPFFVTLTQTIASPETTSLFSTDLCQIDVEYRQTVIYSAECLCVWRCLIFIATLANALSMSLIKFRVLT